MSFLEVATDLKARYLKRAALKNQLAEVDYTIGQRKIILAPADGWPGKNDGERKLSEAKGLSTDEPLLKAQAEYRQIEAALLVLQAEIDGLEDERRALEWQVRQDLTTNLARVEPAYADRNTNLEQSAVDNATQAALDNRAIAGNGGKPGPIRFTPNPAQPKPVRLVYSPPPPPDDLPF